MVGVTVTLYERIQTGTDPFNMPIYGILPVDVENVLYGPSGTSDTDMVNDTSLLDLYIPKGDTHEWTGCRVTVEENDYVVVGRPESWISENVPGPWNRRVRVKRYE